MRAIFLRLYKEKVWVQVILITVFGLGFLSLNGMKSETFPELNLDSISISTVWEGASPEEIQEAVVIPIEEKVQDIAGIEKITSSSSEGMGSVTLQLFKGYDGNQALRHVNERLDAIDTLPDDAKEPIAQLSLRRDPVATLILSGPEGRLILEDMAEDLKNRLLREPTLSQVELEGVPDREIVIEVVKQSLERHGLSMDDIAQAILKDNINRSSGAIESQSEDLVLRFFGRHYRAENFRKIVVKSWPDGRQILLEQCAHIREQQSDQDYGSFARPEVLPAILIQILKTREEDILEIRETLYDFIAKEQSKLPPGVQLELVFDSAEILMSRIDLMTRNGRNGLLLILLSLGIFLNIRLAGWVAVGLPFSVLMAAWVIAYTPVTINVISLFGLILVMGILVDDAIVVGENIYKHRQQGKGPLRASWDGMAEVFPAVCSSIITTVIAFVPFFFLAGMMGKFMWQMAAVVIVCLLASLIECVFVLPGHLAHASIVPKQESFFTRLRHVIDRLLQQFVFTPMDWVSALALRWHWPVAVLSVMTLFIALALPQGGHVRFVFFPEVEGDWVRAHFKMPPGTTYEESLAVTRKLAAAIPQINQEFYEQMGQRNLVEATISRVGYGINTTFNSGDITRVTGPEQAEVVLELLGSEERGIHTGILLERWQELVGPVLRAETMGYEVLNGHPFGKPINIQLKGDDPQQLSATLLWVKEQLADLDGIYDISDTYDLGRRELRFELTETGRQLGLTLDDLSRQIRSHVYGRKLLDIQRGKRDLEIWLRFQEKDRLGIKELESMMVESPSGSKLPLASVARWESQRSFKSLSRENRMPVVSVQARLDESKANAEELRQMMASQWFPYIQQHYPKMLMGFGGEHEEQAKVFASIANTFPIAMAGMLLVLVWMFRSWKLAILILAMIPFGLVGAITSHWAFGVPLTILSFVGVIGLSGVVVNDSVILVDAIERGRGRSPDVLLSVRQAVASRMRPVLLTSISTVAGLSPILLEKSFQAQYLIPMALTVSAGVAAATFYTLITLPSIYLCIHDLGCLIKKIFLRPSFTMSDDEKNQ